MKEKNKSLQTSKWPNIGIFKLSNKILSVGIEKMWDVVTFCSIYKERRGEERQSETPRTDAGPC